MRDAGCPWVSKREAVTEGTHIAGHSVALGVLHEEGAFADRQPHHVIHLPPQGVVNDDLELGQGSREGVGHGEASPPSCCSLPADPWVLSDRQDEPPLSTLLSPHCTSWNSPRSGVRKSHQAPDLHPSPGALTLAFPFHLKLQPWPLLPPAPPAHTCRRLAERTEAAVEVQAGGESLSRITEPRQAVA